MVYGKPKHITPQPWHRRAALRTWLQGKVISTALRKKLGAVRAFPPWPQEGRNILKWTAFRVPEGTTVGDRGSTGGNREVETPGKLPHMF